MAWTDLTFVFGQIITAAELNSAFANFEAVADADSGAPQFEHDSYTNSFMIVGSGDHTTATASLSGTVNTSTTVDIALNARAFFPMIYVEERFTLIGCNDSGHQDSTPRFSLVGFSANNSPYDVRYRYLS